MFSARQAAHNRNRRLPLGLPCGQVISAQRLGDNDYLATCKDKNRYRVYVNAQGRVVAEKR